MKKVVKIDGALVVNIVGTWVEESVGLHQQNGLRVYASRRFARVPIVGEEISLDDRRTLRVERVIWEADGAPTVVVDFTGWDDDYSEYDLDELRVYLEAHGWTVDRLRRIGA